MKKPEIFTGKKKASSVNNAGQTGYLHVEEYRYIHIYHSTQNSRPSRSKTSQHKNRYTEHERRGNGE